MAKERIDKSLLQLVSDLDDHLYLLRQDVLGLRQDLAYLKAVAAELRVLVCLSSDTEGLLWRTAEKLDVSDLVRLHLAGNVDRGHPLAAGLSFAFVPIQRAGFGHPELPANDYSLKGVIKNCEAVFVGGEGLTHEYLIKAIAQQMGSAHEDDDIELSLVTLKQMLINGIQPYVPILSIDSELVLQIGERVLCAAENDMGFKRNVRSQEYGNFSVVVRMGYSKMPASKTTIAGFQSFIADVELIFKLTATEIVCEILKCGKEIITMDLSHPPNWLAGTDAVIVLSYCSRAKQIHAILNGKSQDNGIHCDVGWVHAEDIIPTDIPQQKDYPIYRQFLFTYGRLLSPRDADDLLKLELQNDGTWISPNGRSLFVTMPDRENNEEVFPH
jgi:hypothetical protein